MKGIAKYSPEMELQIVQEYMSGASAKDLANKYGFKTNKSILDKVKKYGGCVRSQREELMKDKIYESFSMQRIDSEFKAYYLGLILSDGYVTHNTVGIDLTDEDCIKFLSSSIGKPYKAYERDGNRKTRFRLIINSPRLVNEVCRYGVVQNKTHILKGFELDDFESKFYPYIIRGLIDGDGWVRKDGNEFYICTASYKFACWMRNILENKLYMNNINITKADGVWQVRTASRKNIEILKLIVYDVPFGMSRKYKLLHSEPSETIMGDLIRD